jgi:hypothetical protein
LRSNIPSESVFIISRNAYSHGPEYAARASLRPAGTVRRGKPGEFPIPAVCARRPGNVGYRKRHGHLFATLITQIQSASPGIFTLDGSGKGQGAIVIAKSGKIAMDPVAGIPSPPTTPGSMISIYATGPGPSDVAAGTTVPLKPRVPALASFGPRCQTGDCDINSGHRLGANQQPKIGVSAVNEFSLTFFDIAPRL